MKWALLASVYSNWKALEAVMKKLQKEGVSKYAFLGDIVGLGPDPEPVAKLTRNTASLCVIGGSDSLVLQRVDRPGLKQEVRQNMLWTRNALSKESADWLGKRPRVSYWGRNTFVHATPFAFHWGDITDFAEKARHKMAYNTLFCGHEMEPIVIRGEERIRPNKEINLQLGDIVCVGSVGFPQGGKGIARYAIWDSKKQTLCFQTVKYDASRFLEHLERDKLSHLVDGGDAVGI